MNHNDKIVKVEMGDMTQITNFFTQLNLQVQKLVNQNSALLTSQQCGDLLHSHIPSIMEKLTWGRKKYDRFSTHVILTSFDIKRFSHLDQLDFSLKNFGYGTTLLDMMKLIQTSQRKVRSLLEQYDTFDLYNIESQALYAFAEEFEGQIKEIHRAVEANREKINLLSWNCFNTHRKILHKVSDLIVQIE